MFDHKSLQLLTKMVSFPKLSIPELRLQMNLSPRQFTYALGKLNDGLTEQSLPKVQVNQNDFKIDKKIEEFWKQEKMLANRQQMFFQETERVSLMYLYTYIRREPIAAVHYQSLFQMSRNTILSDIKKLRALCEEHKIKLAYNRSAGFHLEGIERLKRRFASICIGVLLPLPMGLSGMGQVLDSWNYEDENASMRDILNKTARKYSESFVGNRLEQLVYELSFLKLRSKQHKLIMPNEQINLIKGQPLFEMAKELSTELFDEESEDEIVFLAILMSAAMQGISYISPGKELGQVAKDIISEVERLTLVPFKEKQDLQSMLYQHLVPAYIRIVCDIPVSNPLMETIREEHGLLFKYVNEALKPLSDYAGQPISDEEVGYFTILFGGNVRKLETKSKVYKATIVCPNGISSSMMLRTQLRQLFPSLQFTEPYSISEMKEIPLDSYDMIFSTVYLEAPKPVYLTRPILTALEENYLQHAVAADFDLPDQLTVPINELMVTIRKHAVIKDEKMLYEDLTKQLRKIYSNERSNAPMLSDLLTADKIQFSNDSLGWEEAIQLAAKPLEEQHYITSDYTKAMIDRVTEIGAFIHIGKGIAIPHARPEQGVQELGMSLLRMKEPVLLLDKEEHAIDIFICLAAIDNKLHLNALSELTSFLINDDSLKRLKGAETADDIIAMIQKKGEEEK